MNNHKKLYRDENNKMIGGVCKGLADYFDIDVSLVRALFLLALILKGGGVIIYIILLIVLPKKQLGFGQPYVDYTVPPQGNTVDPFTYQPPVRKKSNFSRIAGVVLIALGSILILDEYHIIPDWDFHYLWPVPMILIGLAIIITSTNNKATEPKSPTE
jgi:phage shock protein C